LQTPYKKEELTLKKEITTNWQSFRKYDESPLETYFRELDLLYRNSTDMDYFDRAMQEDPIYMNKLFITDLKFRNDAKLNFVMSVSDVITRTGSGKSSAAIRSGLVGANIFGTTFDMSHIVWTPEELDKRIERAENKTVWLLDEQRQTNIGLMSQTTQLRLSDYEDQIRQAQVNIIYCAPQLREHNHLYCFETHKLTRIRNQICDQCQTTDLCKQCDKVPFWERSGYPQHIFLMLRTKRITTGMQVPRGMIKVTMPPHEIMEQYWKVKDENVQKMKRKEEGANKTN
jgi:hypothetical protein